MLGLETITNQGPSSDPIISEFNYGYNTAGDVTSWSQQTDSNTPVAYGYGYDGARELLSAIKTSSTGGAALDTYAYRYDPAGNRLSQQINDTVSSSTYNDLNQVTSVNGSGSLSISGSLNEPGTVTVDGTAVVYTDSNNNFTVLVPVVAGSNSIPITATATGTSPGQTNKTLIVTATGGTPIPSLSYDLNGNLASDGTRIYTWDVANRLIAINEPGGAISQFAYDGLGRRVRITETGSNGIVTSTKNLVWDGMTIREERNASNAVTKMYFNNGVQIGGTNYYYTKDHLGSVREVMTVTGTNVNMQTRYDYDSYGQQMLVSGTAVADFGFTGLYFHQPSGLLLAPYREYSSPLGRWISRDPVDTVTYMARSIFAGKNALKVGVAEMSEGPNLYEYVSDDPIDRTDPLGLEKDPACVARCNNWRNGREAALLAGEYFWGKACISFFGITPATFLCALGGAGVGLYGYSEIEHDYQNCLNSCPCK